MATFLLTEKDNLTLENQPTKNSDDYNYKIKKVYRTFLKNKRYQPRIWIEHYDLFPSRQKMKGRVKNKCPLLELLAKGKYCPLLVHEDPVIYNSEDLLNDLLTSSSEDEEDCKVKKHIYYDEQGRNVNPQDTQNDVFIDNYDNVYYNNIFIKTEDCKDDIKLFDM